MKEREGEGRGKTIINLISEEIKEEEEEEEDQKSCYSVTFLSKQKRVSFFH